MSNAGLCIRCHPLGALHLEPELPKLGPGPANGTTEENGRPASSGSPRRALSQSVSQGQLHEPQNQRPHCPQYLHVQEPTIAQHDALPSKGPVPVVGPPRWRPESIAHQHCSAGEEPLGSWRRCRPDTNLSVMPGGPMLVGCLLAWHLCSTEGGQV